MAALQPVESFPSRPEMTERPRLFDGLGLVALPTAVGCARLFTQYTLSNWQVPAVVVADAMTIVSELVALSVEETGPPGDEICWSELDRLSRIVVRLLGFSRHVVIEVRDAATEPARTTEPPPAGEPRGLELVDVVARRWASTASPEGRLTWAAVDVYDQTQAGLPIRRRTRNAHRATFDYEADPELLRRVRVGLAGYNV
jgi:hypothetical protein